jgi:Bacterial TSP3 repeat
MAETPHKLDKKQKLALAGLTFFGILVIAIWLLKLNTEIIGPLGNNFAASNSASTTTETADQQNEDKLKSQDTDGDGLSDWDEINIYHTSPYLADTDSDGIPDGVEVENGTDPNCPQGQNCNSVAPLAPASTTPIIGQVTDGSGTSAQPLASSSQTDLVNLLSGASDAATLRKILIQSGQFDEATLDKISDADLLKAYQSYLASSTANKQ